MLIIFAFGRYFLASVHLIYTLLLISTLWLSKSEVSCVKYYYLDHYRLSRLLSYIIDDRKFVIGDLMYRKSENPMQVFESFSVYILEFKIYI